MTKPGASPGSGEGERAGARCEAEWNMVHRMGCFFVVT